MSLVNATVAVPFIPLLEDICRVLEIGQPQYRMDGFVGGCVSVSVAYPQSSIEHIFHGYGGPTVEECYAIAAQKMCVFLVQKHKLQVYDVNLPLRTRNEHCGQMYGCKRDYFSRLDQGLPYGLVYDITPVEGVDFGAKRVEINFLELLDKVVRKFHLTVTPMTIEHVVPCCFLAWFTIPVPGSESPTHGVMGYKTTTVDAAKQSLAREALILMSMWYRFEIQDVNYYLLAQSSQLMEAERAAYERLRQKVFGLAECKEPLPYVVEQDCATPRGKRNMIPEPHHPPPPPKRARLGYENVGLPSAPVHECPSPDAFSL